MWCPWAFSPSFPQPTNHVLPDGSGCRWGMRREWQPAPSPWPCPMCWNTVKFWKFGDLSWQDPDQQELSLVEKTLGPPGGNPPGVAPCHSPPPTWALHSLPSLGIFRPPTLLEHELQSLSPPLFYLLHKHHHNSNNINQEKVSLHFMTLTDELFNFLCSLLVPVHIISLLLFSSTLPPTPFLPSFL